MAPPISIAPAADSVQSMEGTIASKPTSTTSSSQASPVSAGATFTQKEWIVPPRPKPGRKPATDTPPTKRKAQNRAAQRAFRERRAARVNELEDKIKEIEEEHESENSKLQDRIVELEKELEKSKTEISQWRQRSDTERQLSISNGTGTLQTTRPSSSSQRNSSISSTDYRTSNHDRFDIAAKDDKDLLMGCGNCTVGSRCECVEQVFGFDTLSPSVAKRPPSPAQVTGTAKRPKGALPYDHAALETDFTAQFSAPRVEDRPSHPQSPMDASERCGFCSDGTPCVCAELESQTQQNHASYSDISSNRLAPLLSRFTPPLSETGSSATSTRPASGFPNKLNKLLPDGNPGRSCASGPGTCDQCRSDPNSTIFCKSLAAMKGKGDKLPSTSGGCCGGSATAGGCCKSQGPGQKSGANKCDEKKSEVSLSCADVYTTLSRHPAYEQASDDLGSWLGRLKPVLPHGEQGRPAMEVEAASVMGVLKLFDRRFGRDISK